MSPLPSEDEQSSDVALKMPINDTPFKVKNQIFYSPKVTSASKNSELNHDMNSCSKVLHFKQAPSLSFTPVIKTKTEAILPIVDLNINSPTTKLKYKNFTKDLKELESETFIDQLKYSLKQLPQLP
jgi:hypothetical protein